MNKITRPAGMQTPKVTTGPITTSRKIYASPDGQPLAAQSSKIWPECCRVAALATANRGSVQKTDRANVTRYLYLHPEKFQQRLLAAPTDFNGQELRLAIDCEEDWEEAQILFDTLGPEAMDWRRISHLLPRKSSRRPRRTLASTLA